MTERVTLPGGAVVILDFPTAFRLVKRGLIHTSWRCSYIQTWGGLLCDCGAVEAEWARVLERAS